MNNPSKQIGEHIKQLRTEKSLTQAQLSELAKVSVQQISKMENGHEDVPITKIGRVFRALGCPARLVLYENPSPSGDQFWDNPEAMAQLAKFKANLDAKRGVQSYGNAVLSIDI